MSNSELFVNREIFVNSILAFSALFTAVGIAIGMAIEKLNKNDGMPTLWTKLKCGRYKVLFVENILEFQIQNGKTETISVQAYDNLASNHYGIKIISVIAPDRLYLRKIIEVGDMLTIYGNGCMLIKKNDLDKIEN